MLSNPADKLIIDNQRKLRALEDELLASNNIDVANKAVRFAINNRSSIYCSPVIERFYLTLADNIEEPIHSKACFPNQSPRILHVLTRSYLKGGHTRFVERWMETATPDEVHSVYITDQHHEHEVTPTIHKQTKRLSGKLILAESGLPLLKNAKNLRVEASNYDFIILHHHMHDAVPIVAFGNKNFKQKVIVFNHAGHLFWLGALITDFVIDIERGQNQISKVKRGIEFSKVINLIAPEVPEIKHDAAKVRKKFKIPSKGFVICAMASDAKFTPIEKYNFPSTIAKILEKTENTYFLGIGPHKRNPIWKDLLKQYPHRVILLGSRPFSEVQSLLKSSDLFLDSFPFNSWTSMIDAISLAHLPVLSLKTPVGLPAFLEHSLADTESEEILIRRVIALSTNDIELELNKSDMLNRIKQCSREQFAANIRDVLDSLQDLKHKRRENICFDESLEELDKHFIQMNSGSKSKTIGHKNIVALHYSPSNMRSVFILGKEFSIDY
ncbi:hypothetical protein [Glaciecola sp. MF2-115]|uniref:hypothetical protein n=1 Tax=Glaciecola sp. MF2-115 TaxID=3384827 RepID=UPI0039A0CFD9